MIDQFIKSLMPKELQFYMAICFDCGADHTLTVSRCDLRLVKSLAKKGAVTLNGDYGSELLVGIIREHRQFADKLKEARSSLKLVLESEKSLSRDPAFSNKMIGELLETYAVMTGVPNDSISLKMWHKRNFMKYRNSAIYVLAWCNGDLQSAKNVLRAAKSKAIANKHGWSLPGYICDNIHLFYNRVDKEKFKKDWFTFR